MTGKIIPFPAADQPKFARVPYSIHIVPTPEGFDWDMETDGPVYEYDLASDLAAIALSIHPPRRTFFQRLFYLFHGDD